jgi:hypothetical protein
LAGRRGEFLAGVFCEIDEDQLDAGRFVRVRQHEPLFPVRRGDNARGKHVEPVAGLAEMFELRG